LQDPIRKERNILLQTSRFFCENNFFMDDEKTVPAHGPKTDNQDVDLVDDPSTNAITINPATQQEPPCNNSSIVEECGDVEGVITT